MPAGRACARRISRPSSSRRSSRWHPDLVFYYEGNLDLDLSTIVSDVAPGVPRPAGLLANGLRDLSPYLRTAEHAQAFLEVGEWPKPAYRIHWPEDERDPDVDRPSPETRFHPSQLRCDAGGPHGDPR